MQRLHPLLSRAFGLALAAVLASGAAPARRGGLTSGSAPGRQGGLAIGHAAPAFTLPDVGGRPVRLAALRGKVVVVNFWASWCAPCLEEAPALAAVWRAHHGPGLEVLGLAEESGAPAEVENAALMLGLPYPVLVDDEGAVADRFRVPGYPFTFVLDARGRVRRVFDGAVTQAELEAAVAPLLPLPRAPAHPR